MKSNHMALAVLAALTLIITHASTAQYSPSLYESVEYINPCTGSTELFEVSGVNHGDLVTITINGQTETFHENDYTGYNAWAEDVIMDWASGFGSCHGGGGLSSTQGVETFRGTFSSYRSAPRAARPSAGEEAGGDDESDASQDGSGNQNGLMLASSDIEVQSPYSKEDVGTTGDPVTRIRAGITRESASGRHAVGTNAFLSSNNGGTILSAFYHRNRQNGQFGLTATLTNSEFGNSYAVGAHTVHHGFLGGTLGLMTQVLYEETTDVLSSFINGAYLIGFPIGQRFALNFDVMVGGAAMMATPGQIVPFESRTFYVSQSAILDVYMSDAFAFNVGYRNTQYGTFDALVAGFRGPIFGGRYRF